MGIHQSMRVAVFAFAVSLLAAIGVAAQEPAPQEKIAAFKQAVGQSKAQLKHYEWIETTTVIVKGEVKSQKQNRCYYGADGKVQKVEISATPESQPTGRRLKRRIVAKKKAEMTEYMKKAVDLVHQYVPPEPTMIQYAKDNGKASYGVMEPGKVIELSLKDIIQAGDLMTATLNIQNNQIVDIRVSTWLESQKDGILLNVAFSSLPDGTSYAGETTLDARSKDMKVVVANTGHRRMN